MKFIVFRLPIHTYSSLTISSIQYRPKPSKKNSVLVWLAHMVLVFVFTSFRKLQGALNKVKLEGYSFSIDCQHFIVSNIGPSKLIKSLKMKISRILTWDSKAKQLSATFWGPPEFCWFLMDWVVRCTFQTLKTVINISRNGERKNYSWERKELGGKEKNHKMKSPRERKRTRKSKLRQKERERRAVVMAHLVEQSLPTPDVCGSNPGKILSTNSTFK